MKLFAKVKAVAGATVKVFGDSFINADLLVEEVSFSPRIPKVIGYANVAAQSAARTATFAVMAKPRDKRAWKIALAAHAAGFVTASACYLLDKDNYRNASMRYVERCLKSGDDFATKIIAVKEAA